MSLRVALCTLLACIAGTVRAERPMFVDDAGTLKRGGAKLEFGWKKDGSIRGIEAVAGFSPLDPLEVEVNFERNRHYETDPVAHHAGTGLTLKWVPLQADTGLSVGLKLDLGRTRIDDRLAPVDTEQLLGWHGLLTWRTEAEQKFHLNLGRERVKLAGVRESANTWGIGFEQPLREHLQLTLETHGAEHSRPDKQIGLRWEAAAGLKLSIAAGRGNDRGFTQAGIAWEF